MRDRSGPEPLPEPFGVPGLNVMSGGGDDRLKTVRPQPPEATLPPATEGPWTRINQKALPSAGDQEDIASAG